MKDSTFNIRNKMGKVSETRFLNYLNYENYEITEVSEGYRPDRDIAFRKRNGELTSAEIKADRYNSPNLPIEIESFGKLSGIYSTSAEYYIIDSWIDNKFYVAKSEILKEHIDSNKNVLVKKLNRTNDSETYLYLLNKYNVIKEEIFKDIILPKEVIDINRDRMEELLYMLV